MHDWEEMTEADLAAYTKIKPYREIGVRREIMGRPRFVEGRKDLALGYLYSGGIFGAHSVILLAIFKAPQGPHSLEPTKSLLQGIPVAVFNATYEIKRAWIENETFFVQISGLAPDIYHSHEFSFTLQKPFAELESIKYPYTYTLV